MIRRRSSHRIQQQSNIMAASAKVEAETGRRPMRKAIILALTAAAGLASTAARAGEITGPPPTGNVPSPPNTSISNGNSLCSFSGLNDTPDGIPGVDPGGIAQSFGYFMA